MSYDQPATTTAQTLWRWFTGRPQDGKDRTNARWFVKAHGDHPVLTRTGYAHPFWHRHRIARTGQRTGGTLAALAAAYGLAFHRVATERAALATGIAFTIWLAWRVYTTVHGWRHRWRWHRPLRQKLTRELSAPPPSVSVARDRSSATVVLPDDFPGLDRQKDRVEHIVTTTLALDTPRITWKLDRADGRPQRVSFIRSSPPPDRVVWAEVATHCRNLGPNDFNAGIGRDDHMVDISLTDDSPHFGMSAGTGGTKSNLAAYLLLQDLRRGAIGMVLDATGFSHPWVFKNMDHERDQLPNMAFARRISDLHNAMVWLGKELDRRNNVAEAIINAKGDMRGTVGPRLWIVAEELNIATPLLTQHWAEIRSGDDPRRSPALAGLAAVAFGGRKVKMHLLVIGQMLTAATLGGGAVRENMGVRFMTRYTQNSWNMLVGKDVPMPPSPSTVGRWQCVVGQSARLTQTPLMDLEEVRELATSGTLTPCPAGMPGSAVPDVPERLALPVGASGVVLSPGHVPEPPRMTLSEAHQERVLQGKLDAIKKASQRPGFPQPTAWRGNTRLYDRADLYAYAARKDHP